MALGGLSRQATAPAPASGAARPAGPTVRRPAHRIVAVDS
jgi:hypothetical protein